MRGLSFIAAAVMAAHASADAMDNTLYYVAEPTYAGATYAAPLTQPLVGQPHYVSAQPFHAAGRYAAPLSYERSYPIGGRVIEVPEPHGHAVVEADPAVRYVKVPETLYERFIAGDVHHEVPVHVATEVHKPMTVHHDLVDHGTAVLTHVSPDYEKHYPHDYFYEPELAYTYDTIDGKSYHHAHPADPAKPAKKDKPAAKPAKDEKHDKPAKDDKHAKHAKTDKKAGHANSEATEGHHGKAAAHKEPKHHDAPKAHHEKKPSDDIITHHMTHMIDDHHVVDTHVVHHDLPLDMGHHAVVHEDMYHDAGIHPGLHGEYVDPLVAGDHAYLADEGHAFPHFTHHSAEEPLTHTEEYYYGAPVHHYRHDYHHTDIAHSCWKKVAGRTAGEPLSSCPKNKEKDGALCYDYCDDGYSGVGPVCWQNCPKDKAFRDDGAYCYKPDAYGRGAGEIHNCGPNCEKWGDFWYIKCHPGFHNVGCCVCSPDCPKGMTDIGISCAKHTYSREVGKPLQCDKDQEQSGALCYPSCEHGAKGIGPLCWGKCPPSTRECGALCLGMDEICSEYIANEVKIAYQLVEDEAEHSHAGAIIDMAHIGSDITFPNCPAW